MDRSIATLYVASCMDSYHITGYLGNSEICAFRPKKAILNVCGFFNAQLYMKCGYPIVDDINYANYICAISVLFT